MSPSERVDGTIFEACMMYHPRDGARYAKKEEDYQALTSQGYTKSYIHQQYPMVVKHPKDGQRQVENASEFVALGEGWEPVGYVPMVPGPAALPYELKPAKK